MALDKSIKYNKEYRKSYYGSKAIDKTCRNHGDCPICKGNRLYKNLKREKKMLDRLKEL